KSPHLPESTTKITAESMPEGFFHKEPTLGTPKTGGLDDARIVKPEVPKLTKLGEKPSELPTQNLEAGVDYVDPYEGYRKVPVGTKYTVSPDKMNKRAMVDAIRLGFDVQGLDDKGRIIIKKVKESPQIQLPKLHQNQENMYLDALNLPRTVMASMD